MGNREIKVNDIENVAQITDDLLKTAFTGGAFGYLGNFNTSLGKIRFYATRRNKLLMLKMKDNRKVVITPDDSTAFIAELSKISSAIQQQF